MSGRSRAVALHRLGVRHARETSPGRRAPPRATARRSSPSLSAHDVLRRDERRLDVDLRELRLTVLPQILVAEAARDLEVAVEAGDHEQLLVELRRLRQRVELARVHAARHEIVARALGRRLGEDRRLDLEEAVLAQIAPRHLHEPVAQDDVLLQLRAAQVEKAMAQPKLLGGEILVARARDGNRRRRRRSDDCAAPSREPRRRPSRARGSASLRDARRLRPRRARRSPVRAPPPRRRRRPRSASGRTRPARCPRDRAGRRTRVRRGRDCDAPSRRVARAGRRRWREAHRTGAYDGLSRDGRRSSKSESSEGSRIDVAARTDRARRRLESHGPSARRVGVDGPRAPSSGSSRTRSRFCFVEWFIPVHEM